MKDNVLPDGKWEFDSEVTACFADMLERSIPDYKSMRALTYMIGEKFVQENTLIVDVGCSTGLAVEPFVDRYGQNNRFLLIDRSEPMVNASKERFKDNPNVTVCYGELWDHLQAASNASLVLSILSIQFMPTSYRQSILQNICKSLVPGGGICLCRKSRE